MEPKVGLREIGAREIGFSRRNLPPKCSKMGLREIGPEIQIPMADSSLDDFPNNKREPSVLWVLFNRWGSRLGCCLPLVSEFQTQFHATPFSSTSGADFFEKSQFRARQFRRAPLSAPFEGVLKAEQANFRLKTAARGDISTWPLLRYQRPYLCPLAVTAKKKWLADRHGWPPYKRLQKGG